MESSIRLNDGREMPRFGLGTWQMDDAQAAQAVKAALDGGCRLIDTAAIYENEAGVGRGVKAAGVKREDLFLTTKLWNDRQDAPRAALEESLSLVGLDYVDLYLIHWPSPRQNRYVEAWRGLIELRAAGLARSIGVSNFNIEHLERVIAATGVVPSVNQVEMHPGLQQEKLRAHHANRGIVTQAWSPLGRGAALVKPAIVRLAKKLGRTPAQVVLRWQMQLGLSTIPKSASPARIRENGAIFDFQLGPADMEAIAALDASERTGPDPAVFG